MFEVFLVFEIYTLLITLDVLSLYTNISHEESIAACATALDTRQSQIPPTDNIVTLIIHILRKNNFEFVVRNTITMYGVLRSLIHL